MLTWVLLSCGALSVPVGVLAERRRPVGDDLPHVVVVGRPGVPQLLGLLVLWALRWPQFIDDDGDVTPPDRTPDSGA